MKNCCRDNKVHSFVPYTFSRGLVVFNIAEEKGVNIQHCIHISELFFFNYFVVMWNIIGCWSVLCDWSHNMPGQQISEFTLFVLCGFK